MNFVLRFTPEANQMMSDLQSNASNAKVLKAVQKCLGYLQLNPRHQGLNSHKFNSITGANGEEVFEVYAQNNTPGAYRVFGHYGPNVVGEDGKVVESVITIVTVTPHP